MNNLIRPALYNSKHKISNISSRSNKIEAYDKNLKRLEPLKKLILPMSMKLFLHL